jgi:hypothetical protein
MMARGFHRVSFAVSSVTGGFHVSVPRHGNVETLLVANRHHGRGVVSRVQEEAVWNQTF